MTQHGVGASVCLLVPAYLIEGAEEGNVQSGLRFGTEKYQCRTDHCRPSRKEDISVVAKVG